MGEGGEGRGKGIVIIWVLSVVAVLMWLPPLFAARAAWSSETMLRLDLVSKLFQPTSSVRSLSQGWDGAGCQSASCVSVARPQW